MAPFVRGRCQRQWITTNNLVVVPQARYCLDESPDHTYNGGSAKTSRQIQFASAHEDSFMDLQMVF